MRLIFLSPIAHEKLPAPLPDPAAHNEQLKAYSEVLRKLAIEKKSFFVDLFQEKAGITVFSEPSTAYFSNHWLTAILVEPTKTNAITREDIRLALEKENIESRPLWKPMHLQPVFSSALYYGNTISEKLFENGLCLPSGSNLDDNDRNKIKSVINSML